MGTGYFFDFKKLSPFSHFSCHSLLITYYAINLLVNCYTKEKIMQQEKLNNQNNLRQARKQGYIIIPNYFLREYIKVLGVGPAMFYQYLLTYCHKNKNTAWPSLSTSSKDTGITKKTLTKYYRILIQYGLIKKFSKKKLSSDGYMRNIYQLTPLDGEKITLHKGNFYHNIGVKITPDLGKKLPPNNTNLNITNTTTKDVVVNFKKIKEKGEEKMQEVRERMQEFDFTKSFTEKVLTEYPLKKIEEKLEMYAEGKQVRNPAGWLISALKNDYQDAEQQRHDSEPVGENADDKCRGTMHRALNPQDNKNILSTEEAARRFKLLRDKLMAMKSP